MCGKSLKSTLGENWKQKTLNAFDNKLNKTAMLSGYFDLNFWTFDA